MKRYWATALHIAAGLLFLLILSVSAYVGMLMNFLFVLILVGLCLKLVVRVVSAIRKNIYWDLWRRTLSRDSRPFLLQAILRSGSWIVAATCVQAALLPVQFSPAEWKVMQWILWLATGALCAIEWTPRKPVRVTPNLVFAITAAYCVFELCRLCLPYGGADAVLLSPPFRGRWYVASGGNSPLNNHHHFAGSQRWALDMFLPEDGVLVEEGEMRLTAYRSFGQPILCPANGTVAEVETEAEDQAIGSSDIAHVTGNHVVIRLDSGKYVLLAHLQQGSVLVKTGDAVHTGQPLGACGNSGNTSQPHLHIQAMTQTDLCSPLNRPVPIRFHITGESAPRTLRANDTLVGE